MLKRISGPSNLATFPKTASTAFVNGSQVKLSSGALVQAAAADTIVLGVSQQTIASTDGDYAKTTPTEVDLFDQQAVWECDVTNGGATPGTLTTAMIGQYLKLDAAATPAAASLDSNTASSTPASAGTNWVCIGFISASKGLFKIIPQAAV